MDQDLLRKLQRQRLRMGETGSPLKAEAAADPLGGRSSVEVGTEVHVKQRALHFQQSKRRDGKNSPKSTSNEGQFKLDYWKARTERTTEAAPKKMPHKTAGLAEKAMRCLPTPCRSPHSDRLSGWPSGADVEAVTCPQAEDNFSMEALQSEDVVASLQPQPEGDAEDAALQQMELDGQHGMTESCCGPRAEEEQPSETAAETQSLEAGECRIGHQSAPAEGAEAPVQVMPISAELDDESVEEAPAFSTQVLRPLRDWLAVPTPRTAAAEKAACFSLAFSEAHAEEDLDTTPTSRPLEPASAVDTTTPLEECNSAVEDCLGLLEYDLLDYLDQLPEGLIGKLRGNLQMHNQLVQQLCKRREILQAKARARKKDPAQSTVLRARGPTAAMTAQDEWRRELRAQMASRILAAQEARLRLAAEAHEAAMRAKLEHTRRSAQERVASMAKRADAEEEECKNRSSASKLERERVRRHFDTTKRELERSRAQVAEVEAEIKEAEARARSLENAKRPRVKEAEALRSELKAHRARATRHQGTEQRVKDLNRELEMIYRALGVTASEMETAAGSEGVPVPQLGAPACRSN